MTVCTSPRDAAPAGAGGWTVACEAVVRPLPSDRGLGMMGGATMYPRPRPRGEPRARFVLESTRSVPCVSASGEPRYISGIGASARAARRAAQDYSSTVRVLPERSVTSPMTDVVWHVFGQRLGPWIVRVTHKIGRLTRPSAFAVGSSGTSFDTEA